MRRKKSCSQRAHQSKQESRGYEYSVQVRHQSAMRHSMQGAQARPRLTVSARAAAPICATLPNVCDDWPEEEQDRERGMPTEAQQVAPLLARRAAPAAQNAAAVERGSPAPGGEGKCSGIKQIRGPRW